MYAYSEMLRFSIVIFFLIWFAILLMKSVQLLYSVYCIRQCSDISILKAAQAAARKSTDPVQQKNEIQVSLDAYFKKHRIFRSNPVAKLINVLAEAGIKEERLDTGKVVLAGEYRLFNINNFMKSILSVFLIVGLLGTLIGLAESFSKLQPAMESLRGSGNVGTDSVASAIEALFGKLGNAFTPSVTGVLVTIIGVVLFSIYNKFLCAPIKSYLHHMALTIWIPNLYPNTNSVIFSTLEDSEKQLKRNFQAAQEVAAFADNVKENFKGFSDKLEYANQSLQRVGDVFSLFAKTSSEFQQSFSSVSKIQNENVELYGKILEQFDSIKDTIEDSIGALKQTNDHSSRLLSDLLGNQQQLSGSFDEISNLYEINGNLVKNASAIFESIKDRNTEFIESIKEPLITNIHTNFIKISENMNIHNQNIVQLLAKLDTPMVKAAEKISSVFQLVHDSNNNLRKDLQDGFIKTNMDILEEIKKMIQLTNTLVAENRGLSEAYQEVSVAKESTKEGEARFLSDRVVESQNRDFKVPELESVMCLVVFIFFMAITFVFNLFFVKDLFMSGFNISYSGMLLIVCISGIRACFKTDMKKYKLRFISIISLTVIAYCFTIVRIILLS